MIDHYARNMAAKTWQPSSFGTALCGKRVLIVGHGHIGRAIESRLQGFEVASIAGVGQHAENGVHAVSDLPALLPTADVVVVIVPYTKETKHLIGARELALLPNGALLVNVARGPVVDTEALVVEVPKGRIRAALDVTDPEPLPPEHPLWTAPRVLITPHVGGMTDVYIPRMDQLIAEQMRRFVSGAPLLNVVEDRTNVP